MIIPSFIPISSPSRVLALLVGMTLVTASIGCDALFRDVDEVKLAPGGADAGEDVLDVPDVEDAADVCEIDANGCGCGVVEITWYQDCDGDGRGDPDASSHAPSCRPPEEDRNCRWVANQDDFDDDNPNIWKETSSDDNCQEISPGYYAGCDGYISRKPICDADDPSRTLECEPFAHGLDKVIPGSVAVAPLTVGAQVFIGGLLRGATILNRDRGDRTTLPAPMNKGGFVASVSHTGTVEWAHPLNGEGDDEVLAVAAGADERLYAGGYFSEDLEFAETQLRASFESNTADGFVAAFSNDGVPQWIRHIDGSDTVRVEALAAMPGGGVVGAGTFKKDVSFEGPSRVGQLSFETLQTTEPNNVFIAHWDSDGTLVWASHLASDLSVELGGIAVLSDGRVAVVGTRQTELTYRSGENLERKERLDGGIPKQGFLLFFDENGFGETYRGMYGVAERPGDQIIPQAVAVLDDDSVVVAGLFAGNLNTPLPLSEVEGQQTIFLFRYDASGNALWAKSAGGSTGLRIEGITGPELSHKLYEAYAEVYPDRAFDYSGEDFQRSGFALYGTFTGNLIFGKGEPNVTPLRPVTGRDAFVARFEEEGNLRWARTASVGGSDDFRGGIAATAGGSLMVVGALPNGSARFWSGSAEPDVLTVNNSNSGFLVHLNRSNSPCGDVSGLQEGAPWPMEGYCPTRRGMTPSMGPVVGPMGSITVPGGTFTSPLNGRGVISTDLVIASGGAIYATLTSGEIYRIIIDTVPADVDGPFRNFLDKDGLDVSLMDHLGVPPVLGAEGMLYHSFRATYNAPQTSDPVDGLGYISLSANPLAGGFLVDKGFDGYRPEGGHFIADGAGSLVLLDAVDGGIKWFSSANGTWEEGASFSPPDSLQFMRDIAPTVSSDGRIGVFLRNPNEVPPQWFWTAFDRQGSEMCDAPVSIPGSVTHRPVVGLDDTIYFIAGSATARVLVAIDSMDCTLKREISLTGVHTTTALALDGQGVLYFGAITTGNVAQLISIDVSLGDLPQRGTLISNVAGHLLSTPVIDGKGRLFIVSRDNSDGTIFTFDTLKTLSDTSLTSLPFSMPGVNAEDNQPPRVGFDGQGRLIVGGGDFLRGFQ